MTIVLGLRSPQGVVLAADTQETYQESHKVYRPKLIYQKDHALNGLPMVLAVAGAGLGPWIDKLTTAMWESMQEATGFEDACDAVEKKIKEMYAEYKRILPASYDLHAELIYAIAVDKTLNLFHAFGPVVNETQNRACGTGQAIADFLVARFGDTGDISIATALAVYVLACAKKHADGCGGQSHILWIEDANTMGVLAEDEVELSEALLANADTLINIFSIMCANPKTDPKRLEIAGHNLVEALTHKLKVSVDRKKIPPSAAQEDIPPAPLNAAIPEEEEEEEREEAEETMSDEDIPFDICLPFARKLSVVYRAANGK